MMFRVVRLVDVRPNLVSVTVTVTVCVCLPRITRVYDYDNLQVIIHRRAHARHPFIFFFSTFLSRRSFCRNRSVVFRAVRWAGRRRGSTPVCQVVPLITIGRFNLRRGSSGPVYTVYA